MRIGLATTGLLPLKPMIEKLLSGRAVVLSRTLRSVDAVAGWGHKPTADKARNYARKRGLPYIALEDGLLRSIKPGKGELARSLVIDRSGIYYDARTPSDLEELVLGRSKSGDDTARARNAITYLRQNRLSKYNNHEIDGIGPLNLQSAKAENRVLLVDQTAGDASIAGALATEHSFADMLVSAVTENPECEILIKVHPETILGTKAGHFDKQSLTDLAQRAPEVGEALETKRVRLIGESINPWALLESCSKVYCVSSQLGFEGLLAGAEVHCFGMPFYGGWGLTQDRLKAPDRRKPVTLEALFSAFYFDYAHYLDHDTGSIVEFEDAAPALLQARNLAMAERGADHK